MSTLPDGNRGGNDRLCPWCRGWFEPGRSDQKYCGRSCKSSAGATRWAIRHGKIPDRAVTALYVKPGREAARHPGKDEYDREAGP